VRTGKGQGRRKDKEKKEWDDKKKNLGSGKNRKGGEDTC
jgi:hypothetical protein